MSKLEIEIGDTVEYSVGINKGARGVCIDAYFGYKSYKISWDYYNAWVDFKDLILIKKGKTMQFTKSDLKTGMFVKYRNGGIRLVLDGIVNGDHWSSLLDFDSNLKCSETKERDIMTAYEVAGRGNITMYLNGESLRVIWERTEQTPAQKEMEVLQEQAKALQEQITKLQGTLQCLDS
jgi:hypothetical protein